jgi:acylphosphatase
LVHKWRVIVKGTVQGVGYRAFVQRTAGRLGVDGWVRNRVDGTVETLISGSDSALDELLVALRTGPKHSDVAGMELRQSDEPVEPGFQVLPTE